MLTEFSEFFHVSWTGLLIHASVGTAGGVGSVSHEALWMKLVGGIEHLLALFEDEVRLVVVDHCRRE